MTSDAEVAGRRAEQSDALDLAIRAGFVAYGVVHLLLGFLAVRLALGHHDRRATTVGAMRELAQQPLGLVLVWLVALGMFLLVLWRLLEAAFGHTQEEGGTRWRKRATSAFKGVLYGVIGVSALKVALGGGGSGGSQRKTAELLGFPGGGILVVLVGLGVVGYGGYQAWRGWQEKFTEHLDVEGRMGDRGKAFRVFGKVGYIGKGGALALSGLLLVVAGLTHDPAKGGGLDQALQSLLREPFGPVLIGLVGLGLACYGLFCFARARHLNR